MALHPSQEGGEVVGCSRSDRFPVLSSGTQARIFSRYQGLREASSVALPLCSVSPGKFLGLSGAAFSVPLTRLSRWVNPPLPTRRKEMVSFRICGASSPISGERKQRLRVDGAFFRGIRTYSAGVSLWNFAWKEGQQKVGRELCQCGA